jgi:positive regulator of sigma E activity
MEDDTKTCTCHWQGTCTACKARHAASADALEKLLPKGSRDDHGNSVETLVAALRRAAR